MLIIYPLNCLFHRVNFNHLAKCSKSLSILRLYGNTIIIKLFINLFLPVRNGNIVEIFKINQEVLLSIEFCHFTFYNEIAIFQPVNENFQKAQVSFPSNVVSVFSASKHNSRILLLAQTLYTLFKRSPLKCMFLRFSSARAKLDQIPFVNFELTSQFLLKFSIILHCHDSKLPCKF